MQKEHIITILREQIKSRLEGLQGNLQGLKESRDSDTKSSMGDKYETGREMIQLEMENIQRQIKLAEDQYNILEKLNLKPNDAVAMGSLVQTSKGHYFLSVGVGALKVEKTTVFCISPASPIGQLLLGKQRGDMVVFWEEDIKIMNIT